MKASDRDSILGPKKTGWEVDYEPTGHAIAHHISGAVLQLGPAINPERTTIGAPRRQVRYLKKPEGLTGYRYGALREEAREAVWQYECWLNPQLCAGWTL